MTSSMMVSSSVVYLGDDDRGCGVRLSLRRSRTNRFTGVGARTSVSVIFSLVLFFGLPVKGDP